MSDAMLLVRALRDPAGAEALDGAGWTRLFAMARAENLAGSLAERLRGIAVPDPVRRLLEAAATTSAHERRTALWEAEMARRVLVPLGVPVVLLKGTAYVAAGLAAGQGRTIGDLDILVPRDALDSVEAALLSSGWEWVKADAYDDAYYRRWMHELPPMIHADRGRMIDVHHTVLPLTARITPDAGAMMAARVALGNGLAILSPPDMICHAAAHLFADGDMAGGLRNLWDIHRLIGEFGTDGLSDRAQLHGLLGSVTRAARLAHALYGTPVPAGWRNLTRSDLLFRRRLLARDGWGRQTRLFTRQFFYLRSHWLRMPPAMLARHLWTKWRKGHRPG